MGTITIKSKEPDDLYFLSELVKRLGLEAEIKEDGDYVGEIKTKSIIDYEDTPEGIVEAVKRGLQYIKETKAGLHKSKTLRELITEMEDED